MSPVTQAGTPVVPEPGASAAAGGAAAAEPTALGHPRGLATLFFTEMWERFTYYGIQSILILFLVAASGRGGLGFSDQSASATWGLYLGGTYLLSLLGGWVADRLVGGRVAIAAGGILITAEEVYFHCGKALIRSDLWNPEKQIKQSDFPSLGRIITEQIGEGSAEAAERYTEESYRTRLY